MTVREASSRSPLGFPLLPKVIHRASPGVVVAMGNHDVSGGDFAPLPPLGIIDLVHAPLRSWEQFSRRIRNIGEAFDATPGVGPDVASDSRYLYQRLQDGTLRAWFDEHVFGEAAVHAGLEQGVVVRDDRIARSLAGEPVGAPGLASARALLAARVDVMHEWLIARLAQERAPLAERVAQLDASLAEHDQRLRLITGERDVLSADLEAARRDAATLLAQLEEARARLRELDDNRAVRAALRAQSTARRVRGQSPR
jgi:hypothetical protein